MLETGACGLNAITANSDFIFMGFTMCSEQDGCVLQIYNYDYEKIKSLHLGISQIYTDISLCINDAYLVGSHVEGYVSVISLETDAIEIVEKPFGEVDTIWAAEVIPFRPDGEPQQLLMPTNCGLFSCILTEEGNFYFMMQSHFLD